MMTNMQRGMRANIEQYASHTSYERSVHRLYYWGDSLLSALFCCCTAPQGDKGDPLRPQDHTYLESYFVALKAVVLLAVTVMYIVCLLWLGFALQSLELCYSHDFSMLGALERTWIDANSQKALTCTELLSFCQPTALITLSISGYYTFRFVLYLVSMLPFVWLMSGASLFTDRFMEPILWPADVKEDQEVEGESKHINSDLMTLCCPCRWTAVDRFFSMAALTMFVTHVLMGAVSIAFDFAVIGYFNSLNTKKDQCDALYTQSPKHLMNPELTESDRWCACGAVFPISTDYDANLVKVSGLELMRPSQVATALVVFNVIYTVYALFFCVHTLLLRDRIQTQQLDLMRENDRRREPAAAVAVAAEPVQPQAAPGAQQQQQGRYVPQGQPPPPPHGIYPPQPNGVVESMMYDVRQRPPPSAPLPPTVPFLHPMLEQTPPPRHGEAVIRHVLA